jgi:hypothetical protein
MTTTITDTRYKGFFFFNFKATFINIVYAYFQPFWRT